MSHQCSIEKQDLPKVEVVSDLIFFDSYFIETSYNRILQSTSKHACILTILDTFENTNRQNEGRGKRKREETDPRVGHFVEVAEKQGYGLLNNSTPLSIPQNKEEAKKKRR